MTRRRRRGAVRLVALVAAGALALIAAPTVPLGPLGPLGPLSPVSSFGTAGLALPEAAAAPPAWPIDPSDPSVAAQWGANSGRVATRGPLRLSVDAITPQTPELGGDVSLRVTVTNVSESGVGTIIVRTQRAEALGGAADARLAMSAPEQTFGVATSFGDGFDLGAGQSRTVTVTVPLSEAAPTGLSIDRAGVYPVLINANGRPGDDIEQFLAETRMLVPVRAPLDDANGTPRPPTGTGAAEPGAAGAGGGDADGSGQPAEGTETTETTVPAEASETVAATPVSLVWPLAAEVPLVPGETGEAPGRPELILSNESLSSEMSAGGRLDGLLGALESELAGDSGPALRSSTCVAVDPELLDVANRMADGYRIGTERPSPVEGSTRLRDSWGGGRDLDLREGQGADAAAAWVARLSAATRDLCVVTLPWSGAELGAVAATGDRELATEALALGDGVVEQVLGRPVTDSVIIPPEGYLDAASVPIAAFGDTSVPVDGDAAFEGLESGSGTWPRPDARTTSLVAANSLTLDDGRVARTGDTAEIGPGAAAFGLPAPLSASLAATGVSPEVAGYSAVAGRHDFTADSGVARMQTAVGTLRQELSDASVAAGGSGAAPVVAMPPSGWSATGDEARALLRGVAATVDDGTAEPIRLPDALARSATEHSVGRARSSSPNPDPGAVSGTEVSRAAQQSGYLTDLTVMMANDPQVALTRHGFTQPLRRDVLRALSGIGRRSMATHTERADRSAATMAGMGTMLQQLRDSVTLVAPGGVYTRATDLSPVVIVGRNGLPLPVPAYARVRVGDSETASRHEALLPAKGSLTLQVTPPDPGPSAAVDRDRQNQLHLWLETADGQRISAPVEIVARTGPSTRALLLGSLGLTVVVAGFALWRTGRFEGFRWIRTQWGSD